MFDVYLFVCFLFTSGTKTFTDGFNVDDDMTVEGLIEGVNLLRLYQEAVLSWRDAEISGHKVYRYKKTLIHFYRSQHCSLLI